MYGLERPTKARYTTWVAVSQHHGRREFAKYTDACGWLDEVEPENAIAGFTSKDQGVEYGFGPLEYQVYEIRHAN